MKDLRQQTTDEADSTTEESKKNIRDLSFKRASLEGSGGLKRASLEGSGSLRVKEEKGVRSGKTANERILDNSDDMADTNRNLAPSSDSAGGGGGGGGLINAETLEVTICKNGLPVEVQIFVDSAL